MNQRHLLIVSGWALSLLLTSLATAEDTTDAKTPKTVDPTGTWQWDVTFNDNPAEFQLQLDWDGEKLAGEYTAFNNTTKIEEVKLDGDELSFISNREFNGNEFVVRFQGTVEPDDIKGTVGVDFGEGPREFDWHAKRVVTVEDVLGRWKLRLDTPNGVVEPELTIEQQGKLLLGGYSSPFGNRRVHDLKLDDNELSWMVESDDDDQFEFEIVYRGKPRGNTITGTNEYDFGGNTGTMEFTGKRTPPEQADMPDAEASDETPAAAAPADVDAE